MGITYDSIGTVKDTVQLRLGELVVTNPKSYDVACSVFSQPCAFALSFGWGDTAGELLERYPKGTPFQLLIAGVPLMTGKIDSIGATASAAGGATVNVRGRDNLTPLFKSMFFAEKSYSEATYYQLTRKMLEDIGLGDTVVHADNTANRKAVTGHKVVVTKPPIPSDTIEVEQTDTNGQRKVVYNTIKAQLGERRYDFLKRHYKKAGLFLWCAGDGSLVLGTPNGDQEAGFSVVRGRGQTRNDVNVEDVTFDDNSAERYSRYIVYGRTSKGKKGRVKCRGEWVDAEMVDAGFTEVKSMADDQVKSDAEAALAARREGAMQIRNGWRLTYRFSGHLMPSLFDRGAWAIWAPDTVCNIVDQELPQVSGLRYVSDVNFRRDLQGGTTTTVRFMRRDGLVFAESTT